MRLKLIACQVFTREFEHILARSPHSVELELIPMGLHSLGVEMRPHLQERIAAADALNYDAILLGYALCGRGTEGLRAGRTQLILPRAHDCIGVLMGDRHRYAAYFEDHPGVYYRSPGWVEYQTPDLKLQPAFPSQKSALGEQTTLDEFIAKYGEDNGRYLYEQFSAFRRTTRDSPTSPPESRKMMPAACRPAPKPKRKNGPSKKSPARSRFSIASSTALGTTPTFSSFNRAQPSAPTSATRSWMLDE